MKKKAILLICFLLITVAFIFHGCIKDESTTEAALPALKGQIIGKWKVDVEYIKDYYLRTNINGDTITFRDDEFEYFYDSTDVYFYSDSTFWFDIHDHPGSLSPGDNNNWGGWKPMPDAFDNKHFMMTDPYFQNCGINTCYYSTFHILSLTSNSLVLEYTFEDERID